jgi:hypothetical protein
MNQPPPTLPVQPTSIPTAEDVVLFNAGIAWLTVAGFPKIDLAAVSPTPPPDDAQHP